MGARPPIDPILIRSLRLANRQASNLRSRIVNLASKRLPVPDFLTRAGAKGTAKSSGRRDNWGTWQRRPRNRPAARRTHRLGREPGDRAEPRSFAAADRDGGPGPRRPRSNRPLSPASRRSWPDSFSVRVTEAIRFNLPDADWSRQPFAIFLPEFQVMAASPDIAARTCPGRRCRWCRSRRNPGRPSSSPCSNRTVRTGRSPRCPRGDRR